MITSKNGLGQTFRNVLMLQQTTMNDVLLCHPQRPSAIGMVSVTGRQAITQTQMKDTRYLELSDAVTQCKSHVGQLGSMLWIRYRYA